MKLRRCITVVFVSLFTLGACIWGVRQNSQATQQAGLQIETVRFTDITAQSGIRFRHNSGADGIKFMPEPIGSGVAFIDYDSDGDQDIFLVNARDWTQEEIAAYERNPRAVARTSASRKSHLSEHSQRSRCALYRNDGLGRFADVTRGSGLDVEMYGHGAAVGDYDNDGKPDVFVSGYGRSYLFHNRGVGRFAEVAQAAGVRGDGWSTSAAWFDYDKDGWLDLFVCHYLEWMPALDMFSPSQSGKGKTYGIPAFYAGQVSHLFHNEGATESKTSRFRDVTVEAGIALINLKSNGANNPSTQNALSTRTFNGKSLGVAVADYNKDSWPDIFVANDGVVNYLFLNNKDGTFTERGTEAGVALGPQGRARAGMGVDVGDIDGSGNDSLIIGNFDQEMLGLYQNLGNGLFNDVASHSSVAASSLQILTFGCSFLDVNNDGWLDIVMANGHVDPEVPLYKPQVGYAQRPLLFLNQGQSSARFLDASARSGKAFRKRLVARGVAHADIDLDGDVDVIFSTLDGPSLLLRNDVVASTDKTRRNNSLRLTLKGNKSNRSAIGARVEAQLGERTLHRTIKSGGSYLSQSELPLTLGLGQADKVEQVTIYWPSGNRTQLAALSAKQMVDVEEGRGVVRSRPFTTESSISRSSDRAQ
jgi:hypothetical protein